MIESEERREGYWTKARINAYSLSLVPRLHSLAFYCTVYKQKAGGVESGNEAIQPRSYAVVH